MKKILNIIRKYFTHKGYPFHIKGRDDIIMVHITKTAGTSLRKALNVIEPFKQRGLKKHLSVREIINIIGQEKWDNSFKFTFIRNPFDRLLSSYHFKLRNNLIHDVSEKKSFELWFLNEMKRIKKNKYPKSGSQTNWLINHKGKIDIDFIGRFENLAEDCKKLEKHLGFKFDLKHYNQSESRAHYSQFYSDDLKKSVEEVFEEDLINFNYSFERKQNNELP